MIHAIIDNIPDNPREIYDYANSKSFGSWIDEMGTVDNPTVWTRSLSKLSFDDAFKIVQENTPHWVISFRNRAFLTSGIESDYWEFGGCNIASSEYGQVFIWIQVSPQEAFKLFDKFNLKVNHY